MLLRRWRILAAFAVALFMMTSMSGCGGAGSVLGVLRIVDAAAHLDDGGFSSRTVINILADISGYTAVKQVVALVKNVSGSQDEVTLTLNSTGQYAGEYTPDTGSGTVDPKDYTVVVQATDVEGNTAQSTVPVETAPASGQ